MRILLVEDDPLLGDGLSSALKANGETVDWLTNGHDALHSILSEAFDIVILDLGLPGLDGLEVLKQSRDQKKDIPVLILTARDQVADRIKGLDLGADDYLVKPFDLEELEARIRALTRRYSGRSTPDICLGDLTITPEARKVLFQQRDVKLSRREYSLLFELASHPGKVISRTRLEDIIYGWEGEVDSNALEVHIHHLRKKLGSKQIKTVRGIGYVIEAPA